MEGMTNNAPSNRFLKRCRVIVLSFGCNVMSDWSGESDPRPVLVEHRMLGTGGVCFSYKQVKHHLAEIPMNGNLSAFAQMASWEKGESARCAQCIYTHLSLRREMQERQGLIGVGRIALWRGLCAGFDGVDS
jgi:hypothetical protein